METKTTVAWNGYTFRTVTINNKDLWCAADICNAVGFVGNSPHQHVRRHCLPEHGICNIPVKIDNNRTKRMIYISSYNVWRLLLCVAKRKKAAESLLAVLSPYLHIVDAYPQTTNTVALQTADYQKLEESVLAGKSETSSSKEHLSETPKVTNNNEKEICMSEVMNFEFKGQRVRTLTINNEPWWFAKDIAAILGYSETAALTRRLDEDEKTTLQMPQDGSKYTTNIVVVSESGLYAATLGSNKPEAKEFKRWVTHEVLPCIRKTGMFTTEQAAKELLNDPLDKLQEVLDVAKSLREANAKLQHKVATQEPIVQAANKILDSDRLTTTTAVAKQIGVSTIELNAFLHAHGVLFRIGKSGTYVPYAKYHNAELGKLTVHAYTKSDNTTGTSELWKWSEKGRQFVIKLWHEKHPSQQQPLLPLL